MVKPEWGIKRTCKDCGARFYDLRRDPITCPKCGAAHQSEPAQKPRRNRRAAKAPTAEAAAALLAKDKPIVDEAAGIEGQEEEQSEKKGELKEEDIIEDVAELGEDKDDVAEVGEKVDQGQKED